MFFLSTSWIDYCSIVHEEITSSSHPSEFLRNNYKKSEVKRHTMGVIRVICDPPLCGDCETTMLHIRSRRQFRLFVDDVEKYISHSFIPLLREMIPRDDMALGFGGYWFWSTYFHALSGEDLLLDLSGTGISLSEDSLDTQVSLRKKFHLKGAEKQEMITDHCASKIEAICAICLSIVLHVARQPMLENEQGPHALVLCATKDQCDEIYSLLDRMGSALHLVTHNLFGGYPSMPSGRRADIVVGTLPLWEGVANLNSLSIQNGLEEVMHQVSGDSRWTSSSTRWRPYTLGYIAQLFFVDLGLQNALGYLPMLQRVVTEHRKQSLKNNGMEASRLPQGCQLYSLSVGENGTKAFEKLRATLHTFWNNENKAVAELASISLASDTSGCGESKAMECDISRKRMRNQFHLQEGAEKEESKTTTMLQSRLLVHNALSHSRLLLDESVLEDFALETKRRARCFWSRFEMASSSAVDTARDIIDIQLAYKCRRLNAQKGGKEWHVAETVAIVTPTGEAMTQPTRTQLLMKHLEDELSGEIFDGSVVYCYNECEDGLALVKVDAVEVSLHNLFETTSTRLSQEAIFLSVEESPGSVIENQHRRLHELRCQAVKASSVLTKDEGSIRFPTHKFLTEVSSYPRRSVLAFRQIAHSMTIFCGIQSGSKPLALLYLEECCQYGRVVSYFVHEQHKSGTDTSKKESCVHFFVEFGTPEAAIEAARQFSLRFSSEIAPPISNDDIPSPIPRVKLFSNELYYEGVVTELEKLPDLDEDEADFIDVSLLDE